MFAYLRISRKAFAATLAGLLGGSLAAAILSLLNVRWGAYSPVALALLIGAVVGALVPGAINAVPGALAGQTRRAGRNAGAAAGVGVVAMALVSLGLSGSVPREAIFFQGSLWLGLLAWLLFGLALGAIEGIVWRSAKRALLGAAGGGLGALLAYAIGRLLDNEGAFVLVGPLIGLFANLLPDVFKTVWVQVTNGSRQFEITLDRAVVVFGSSDDPRYADVGLYGDRAIAPRHFLLERHDDRCILMPLPQTGPVLVNGVPALGAVLLRHDDVIMVGRTQIRLCIRKGG
jgi:hypothetical protein